MPELRDEFLNKIRVGFLEEICFHIYLKRLVYIYIYFPFEGIYFPCYLAFVVLHEKNQGVLFGGIDCLIFPTLFFSPLIIFTSS